MPDRWFVPESLRARMIEVARRFRKQPTASEARLWQELRGAKLAGRKFRRQQPIGPFVVDFFCPAARVIVEVDGPIHDTQIAADRQRQELLESLGLRILRVSAQLVEEDMPAVLATIAQALAAPHPPASSPLVGEGEQG